MINRRQMLKMLATIPIETFGGEDTLELNVFMMQPEEMRIVVRRLKELLEQSL